MRRREFASINPQGRCRNKHLTATCIASGRRQGRAEEFCRRFGLRAPILQAPMAGACRRVSRPPWRMPAA